MKEQRCFIFIQNMLITRHQQTFFDFQMELRVTSTLKLASTLKSSKETGWSQIKTYGL